VAIADVHIDETNADPVFELVAWNLLSCTNTRFALACSIDGTLPNTPYLFLFSDLEEPPVRQLSYALTKTALRISNLIPSYESKVQNLILDYLGRVQDAFIDTIAMEGLYPFDFVSCPRCKRPAFRGSGSHWLL
jgi:hypothetical protein